MDAEESTRLIQLQASQEPALQRYFKERILHYRSLPAQANGAMALALADLELQHGTQVLHNRWKLIAAKASNPVRLAGLTGVLEILNFTRLMAKSDKDTKDYGMLAASGLSLASVYTTVATSVSKEFYSDASKSFANAKALGGLLGGAATMIGVFFDGVQVFEQKSRGHGELAFLYFAKGFAGSFVTGGQLLTAFSYSSPLIERLIGHGKTVTFLNRVKFGIEGQLKIQAKKAAGVAVAEAFIEEKALLNMGQWILRAASWEVTVAIIALQITIWVILPNELENWCERNTFGRVRPPKIFGIGGSGPKYKTAKEQEEEFYKSISSVHIACSEKDH